jgi:hypothetical protein
MRAWPPFESDDEASAETVRVLPPGGDDGYHPPAASSGYGPYPTSPPYPTGSSGPPYGAPAPYGVAVAYGPPPQPAPPVPPQAHTPSIARLFMVTVMVVVVVAGAVSIAYILTGGRKGGPQPGPVASAPPPSGSAAAPSASSRADGCVIGEWQATSWRLTNPAENTSISTDNGGFLRLRADGTGEFDFGSGVMLKGKLEGKTSEVMIIGKIEFSYETDNGALTTRVVAADARRVVLQSGRTVANERFGGDDGEVTSDAYTCSGDVLRFSSDVDQLEYHRR